MKKIVILLAMLTMAYPVMAQEQGEDWEDVLQELEEDVQPSLIESAVSTMKKRPKVVESRSPTRRTVKSSLSRDAELIDMDKLRSNTRVKELERRIGNLEREVRFHNERLRSLDWLIAELRRKVNR